MFVLFVVVGILLSYILLKAIYYITRRPFILTNSLSSSTSTCETKIFFCIRTDLLNGVRRLNARFLWKAFSGPIRNYLTF